MEQTSPGQNHVTPPENPSSPSENPPEPPEIISVPVKSPVKSEPPPAHSKETIVHPISLPPETPCPPIEVVTVPSYGRWFSFNSFHETERRMLPEFFDGKSPSKNHMVYKYLRDFMVKKFRENPSRKITFTETRRMLVGDVGMIRRVFDFLETWGLINYTATTKQQARPEERFAAVKSQGSLLDSSGKIQNETAVDVKENSKKVCNSCNLICKNVCFACPKVGTILCATCFIRGNRVGIPFTNYKRIDLIKDLKTDWTEKETLQLLEAILQYGDDWKKVAEHVRSRTEKECIARFIRLPFGEQFIESQDFGDIEKYVQTTDHKDALESETNNITVSSPTKRRHLTPLADASNPIMAQVAFLAAMVGSEVAEAAAQAAVAALCNEDLIRCERIGSPAQEKEQQEVEQSLEAAAAEARTQLDQEEQDMEQSISGIIGFQMKEIQEKINHFEQLELVMEKERLQLDHMKSLVFADQLSFLQQQRRLTSKSRLGEEGEKDTASIITVDAVT